MEAYVMTTFSLVQEIFGDTLQQGGDVHFYTVPSEILLQTYLREELI